MEELSAISKGLGVVDNKEDWRYTNNQIIKSLKNKTKLDTKVLNTYKMLKAYQSRGWNNNPLDLDKEEPHKDKLSTMFKKLYDTLLVLAEMNDLELLEPYLNELSILGVKIDVSQLARNSEVKHEDYDYEVSQLCNNVDEIDKLNDELKALGEEAVLEGFCSSNRFKTLAEQAYKLKKKSNESLIEKLNEEVVNNTLDNKGIDEVLTSCD